MGTGLPAQGSDNGTWGTALNTYLEQFTDGEGNLLEASVAAAMGVTTEGDLAYYHGGALTRLPAGLPGEVVSSTGTAPAYTSGGVNAISSGVSAYTLVAADNGKTVVAQNTTTTTITIPTNASVAFPVNAQIVLQQGSTAGPISMAVASGVTLTGVAAVNSPGGALVLTQTSANVWTGASTRNDPLNTVAASGSSQTLVAGYMNRVVLSANCTFALPPAVAGSSFTAAILQPASGGPYTPTLTGANYGTGGTPTWSTANGKKDLVVGYCDDNSTWDVVFVGSF